MSRIKTHENPPLQMTQEVDRYRNDPRYLRIWIAFVCTEARLAEYSCVLFQSIPFTSQTLTKTGHSFIGFLCQLYCTNLFPLLHCLLFCQAESTKRPRDVYQFLEMRGVGGRLALLYETWAASALNAGEHDDVAQILTRGIEKYVYSVSWAIFIMLRYPR